MTPTRNEAAERLRGRLRARDGWPGVKDGRGTLEADLDAALAAEREPLLAALRALVEATENANISQTRVAWQLADEALDKARALIEQYGRTGLKADPFDRGLTEPQP